MKREDIIARMRYAFDKSMAAGTAALIGWLAVASLILIAIAGLVVAALGLAPEGQPGMSLGEAIWASLMRTLDPGTMGADTGWGFRLVMLAVTIGGIFVVSTLIGVLAAGIDTRLKQLRRGRSRVLETGHTVILNWSPSIFDIISELVNANARRHGRQYVVILAPRDKIDMEEEIAAKVRKLGNTRVICRSGEATDLYDLSLVSVQQARSIIVLSPDGEDPDSQVVKTILALTQDPQRRPERYRIVAEIHNARNGELALAVGGSEVQLVLADELIARIVVNSLRQSGLSAVYSELLDFAGSELYTVEQPELAGNTFGDALMAYPEASLIGVADNAGRLHLNPSPDLVIERGVRCIFIARDLQNIRIETQGIEIDNSAITLPDRTLRRPERTLMLGWNRRAPIIARELSRYVQPGSVLTVAADIPDLEAQVTSLPMLSANLAIEYAVLDTASRDALEALDIGSYDHVLVLGYPTDAPPRPSDTRTLVTLLHLRRIAEATGQHLNVVSEMIDVRNRTLAEVTRADDFVVSNRLVSQMLAQASENAELAAVFDELLDETGSEIYMRAAGHYVEPGIPVTFYTIVEAARRRGEIAIGYARRREENTDPENPTGVAVNPPKTARLTFQPGDRVIVVARHE